MKHLTVLQHFLIKISYNTLQIVCTHFLLYRENRPCFAGQRGGTDRIKLKTYKNQLPNSVVQTDTKNLLFQAASLENDRALGYASFQKPGLKGIQVSARNTNITALLDFT